MASFGGREGGPSEEDMEMVQHLKRTYTIEQLRQMFTNAPSDHLPLRGSVSSQSSLEAHSGRSSFSSFRTVNSATSFGSAASASPHVAIARDHDNDALIAQSKQFPCPICAEIQINSGAAKRGDLVRHMMRAHKNEAEWACTLCKTVCDWKAAYEHHMKTTHQGRQPALKEARIALAPQLVFGCGFQDCPMVFEAGEVEQASDTANDYFNHISNHIKAGKGLQDWSYSTKIGNLLRQRYLIRRWRDETSKHRVAHNWQIHNSGLLRKMLECRAIGNIENLIAGAHFLSSGSLSQSSSPQPNLTGLGFFTPVRGTVTVTRPKVRPRGGYTTYPHPASTSSQHNQRSSEAQPPFEFMDPIQEETPYTRIFANDLPSGEGIFDASNYPSERRRLHQVSYNAESHVPHRTSHDGQLPPDLDMHSFVNFDGPAGPTSHASNDLTQSKLVEDMAMSALGPVWPLPTPFNTEEEHGDSRGSIDWF